MLEIRLCSRKTRIGAPEVEAMRSSDSAAASIDDYWIDGGGSDGELRCALEGFCDMDQTVTAGIGGRIGIDEAYGDVSGLDQSASRKRIRDQSSIGTRSKACREKMRRDKLNDRFLELSAVLDPGKPPKLDKSSILSDAARMLVHLKAEAQELKETNEKLQETIRDLKVEKNELRDEKMKMKADKEKLEQQLNIMSVHPPSFVPHPMAFHHQVAPAAAYHPCVQPQVNKPCSYPAFPGMAMWQLFPPTFMDTSQDTELVSRHA